MLLDLSLLNQSKLYKYYCYKVIDPKSCDLMSFISSFILYSFNDMRGVKKIWALKSDCPMIYLGKEKKGNHLFCYQCHFYERCTFLNCISTPPNLQKHFHNPVVC